MTSTSPLGTLGSVASLLAETFDKGNRDRNHKSLENVSTELQAFYILHHKFPLQTVDFVKVNFLRGTLPRNK